MMREFYYADGERQLGPFGLEELKGARISKDTLMWYEGLEGWVAASEVEELKGFFKSGPPPLPFAKKMPPPVQRAVPIQDKVYKRTEKEGNHRKAILIVLAIASFLVLGSVSLSNMYSNNAGSSNDFPETEGSNDGSADPFDPNSLTTQSTPPPKPREKTEEELRQELYAKEIRKPLEYLSETHSLSYKLFSGKDEISGEIYNAASMATFKDVVLTVVYLTDTETELGRENFVVYKYCYPGTSTSYVIKTYSPSGTRRIGVEIGGAKGE